MPERKIKLTATIIDEDPGDGSRSMIRSRLVAIDLAPVLGDGEWELDINDPIVSFPSGDTEITLSLDAADDDELLWEDEFDEATP